MNYVSYVAYYVRMTNAQRIDSSGILIFELYAIKLSPLPDTNEHNPYHEFQGIELPILRNWPRIVLESFPFLHQFYLRSVLP